MTAGSPQPRASLAGRALQRAAGLGSDRFYLRLLFRRSFGYWPDLRAPRSFNEKLLVYKLTSRGDPRFPLLADKIEVKQYVAARIGHAHVVPALWHGTALPPRGERRWPIPYVIKASHGWSQNHFVRSPADQDWASIERLCARWLASTHGRGGREWHYARIRPRLLIEPYVGTGDRLPTDFKLFVFAGQVRMIQVVHDRGRDERRAFLDPGWSRQPFHYGYAYPSAEIPVRRPDCLEQMIAAAEILADDLPFVRVDLYEQEGSFRFGEMTFYPYAGCAPFTPSEADLTVGAWWPDPRPA